jgi:hypothetical protein
MVNRQYALGPGETSATNQLALLVLMLSVDALSRQPVHEWFRHLP